MENSKTDLFPVEQGAKANDALFDASLLNNYVLSKIGVSDFITDSYENIGDIYGQLKNWIYGPIGSIFTDKDKVQLIQDFR